MDTTHLTLRAAKKLNPKLQCWRWIDGFTSNFTYAPGRWIPVDIPKWLPHCIYATTDHPKKAPAWTPTDEQLKASKRLKRNFESGKKSISQPETSPSSP